MPSNSKKSLESEKNKNLLSRECKNSKIGQNDSKNLIFTKKIMDWTMDFKDPQYITQFQTEKYRDGSQNPTLIVVQNSYTHITKRYEDRGNEKPIMHLFNPWRKMAQNTYVHWVEQKGQKTAQESLKFLLQAFHLQLKRVVNYSKSNLSKALEQAEPDMVEIIKNASPKRKIVVDSLPRTERVVEIHAEHKSDTDDVEEVEASQNDENDDQMSEPPTTPKLYADGNESDFKPDYDE